MTRALLLVALVLAATLAPGAHAVLPVFVAISAPPGVGTGDPVVVMGRVDTVQAQSLPRASVTILLDGAPVATATADNSGFYRATATAPTAAGDHVFQARAQSPGGLLTGESRNISVMVRERSLPPQNAVAANDGVSRSAYVSWHPPVDTNGAPLTGYRITRQSGAFALHIATVNASTLTFEDLNVGWSTEYRYRVHAVTFAGASPASNAALVRTPAQP